MDLSPIMQFDRTVVDRSTQPWPMVTDLPIVVAADRPVGDVLAGMCKDTSGHGRGCGKLTNRTQRTGSNPAGILVFVSEAGHAA